VGSDKITAATGETVTVTIAQAALLDLSGGGSYNIKDTLSAVLTEAAGGSSVLASAAQLSVTFTSGTEVVTLTGLDASTAPSAIDFSDDAATLTLTEFNALAAASVALTGADTITLDAVNGDDVSGTTLTGVDTITAATGETVTVTIAQAALLDLSGGGSYNIKDLAANVVNADGSGLSGFVTGSVNVQITDQPTLAQLKAINDATGGTITLDDSSAALSGSAADLAAALTGITGYTGNVTVADQATLTQLVTINNAVDGSITLDVTAQALSGSSSDMAAAFAGITNGYEGNLTISGTLTGAAGVSAVNTVAGATTGKVSATLQATATELASLASAATDEILITVTDAASTAVEATALSAIGGKTASDVTVTNAIVVSGTLAEATAAFVTADTLVLGANAVVQLDDPAGSTIAASNLNTLAGVVASVEVSSGIVLTGAQADVTTALTTDGVTYPSNDYDVAITGAFGIDAALVNMYNAVAASTSGELSVTGTGFGETLNASSFAGDGTKGLTINGGGGNDTVVATSFGDVVNGGTGADNITGGAGADLLTGGTGNDIFIFNSSSESAATVAANTTVSFDDITDFTSGADKLQLNAVGSIDFGAGAAANVTAVSVSDVANFADLEAAIETAIGGSLTASDTSTAQVYDVTLTGTGLAAAGVSHLVTVNNGDDAITGDDLMVELSGSSSASILSGDFQFIA
jgi:hypothetical protein